MFIRHGQGLWFLISLAQNYIKELFEQCDCEADCGSEHVGAGTKHCPRDPGSWVLTQKLSDFPSSIPLWECQSNIPSPIYPIHPELDFTLTKTDSMNRYRKVWHQPKPIFCNAISQCQITSHRRWFYSESWFWQHCNRDFLPETESQSPESASDSLWLRLWAESQSNTFRCLLLDWVTISTLVSADIQSWGKSRICRK